MKNDTLNYINYRILLYSNSIVAFSMGLFMPFYVLFIQDFGGSVESFGFAFGLMILAQSSTSYFAGKYSDKFGRKIFLIVPGFVITILIILYTLITSLIQLYILQIILGISSAIQQTMETTMLGDVTEKVSRGADIGKYHAIIGVAAAIAMMGGGYVVGQLGIEIIFYIVAAFSLISTILLFYIKEK